MLNTVSWDIYELDRMHISRIKIGKLVGLDQVAFVS